MSYDNAFFLILGAVIGFGLSVVIGGVVTYKAQKKSRDIEQAIKEATKHIVSKIQNELPPPIPKEPDLPPELLELLNRMNAISEEQQHLAMSLDGPLRGALDAKNKKQNVGRLHMLDQEKFEILNKIKDIPESTNIRFFMKDLATGNVDEVDVNGMIKFLKEKGTFQDKVKEKPNLSLVKPDKDEMH